MKVLIVDDSAVMRSILTKAMSKLGVGESDVTHAGDGAEGIQHGVSGVFDIILMDWNMPKTNGLDAVKAIRSAGVKTPIVMVTTEAEKSRVVEAIQAGANNYVVKPFEDTTLVEKVKATLQ
jgi:two-component system chemotaxis response regulator CheY